MQVKKLPALRGAAAALLLATALAAPVVSSSNTADAVVPGAHGRRGVAPPL
jgi:hypothetical protein